MFQIPQRFQPSAVIPEEDRPLPCIVLAVRQDEDDEPDVRPVSTHPSWVEAWDHAMKLYAGQGIVRRGLEGFDEQPATDWEFVVSILPQDTDPDFQMFLRSAEVRTRV